MTTTYAIVDIETTGTNPKEDRIFQFGCVFVEEGKIVGRFATNIHPNRSISPQIQHLTHTTNQDVKNAPYFEDVAPTIYELLSGTVFVAHNIHFDYRFLNAELERCGSPALQLKGIDTVELAQILFPTEVSFRLSDLSVSLGLEHDRPHQADSDAEVTASLFIALEQKLAALPLCTLKKLSYLGQTLSMQTGELIQHFYLKAQKKSEQVSPTFIEIEEVALQRKQVVLFDYSLQETPYPKSKQAKGKWLNGQLEYRQSQQSLMNLVYKHYTEEEPPKDLIIESETGSGKTIGYLFPASFLATPTKPLIISTASILLQHQLDQQDIPKLNALVPQPLKAVILKGRNHYLDLEKFNQTLKEPTTVKQVHLFQMMILVWLTETKTGDLDELNLLSMNHPYFEKITHRGIESLREDSPFYEVDFLRFLYAQAAQSNVLIVNHAFLAYESQREAPLLPETPYLLVDEAHHLPEALEKVATKQVNTAQFLHKIQEIVQESFLWEWSKDETLSADMQRNLELYGQLLDQLTESIEELNRSFYEENRFVIDEFILTKAVRESISVPKERMIQKLIQTFEDCVVIQERMTRIFTLNAALFLQDDQAEIERTQRFFQLIAEASHFFQQWFYEWQPAVIHRLSVRPRSKSLCYELIDFEATKVRQTRWYNRAERIVYLGATMTVPGDKKYLARKLGILDAKIKVMPVAFDYRHQGELFILSKAEAESNKMVTTIEAIRSILKNYKQSVLVLFTSHQQLQEVYQALHFEFLQNGREILAQGIGGSRQKLLKKFTQSKSAVLFGADSFWEGLDLPADQLQLLVVTKLPFENPKRPFVAARYHYLKELGQNPFKQETLPKAMIKLRQGFGRLIRSSSDRGMMIILDQRMEQAYYAKKMHQVFPKDLPVTTGNLTDLKRTMVTFFDKEKK
ncbi:helicase C-terminal domain-containing protein [Enterococcus camelliae]|uniref:3'-5' exonuclease DinG n=1 Tax=Enterococcus camelliae TaxID=453959 RepID=A0ABW5TIL6_9ENTE